MNLDSTLAVTNTCPKDGVHLSSHGLRIHHSFGVLEPRLEVFHKNL